MLPNPEETRYVLIGESARTRQVIRMIEKLGKCRWPALLLGETGTGKEVVARAIHNINAQPSLNSQPNISSQPNPSPQANVIPQGPFVTIDCSAMVGPLMESELFGHVKGAFTGAAMTKIGLIEAANSGTAFFDEIGELPLDLQAKLLRVLQEKEFRPVGSLSSRRSDFRIIAATNRDLGKEVEKGTFRRDLYFRLNVINIRLSPLRERKEDIPSLIHHFVGRVGGNYSLTPEALEVLISYDWPGNIRELENCVQHMVAINSGPLLHVADLPSNLQNHLIQKKSQYLMAAAGADAGASHQDPGDRAVDLSPVPTIVPLAELERRAILNALDCTNGDRAIAAHRLGIGRTTLYRKLKEYDLAS